MMFEWWREFSQKTVEGKSHSFNKDIMCNIKLSKLYASCLQNMQLNGYLFFLNSSLTKWMPSLVISASNTDARPIYAKTVSKLNFRPPKNWLILWKEKIRPSQLLKKEFDECSPKAIYKSSRKAIFLQTSLSRTLVFLTWHFQTLHSMLSR